MSEFTSVRTQERATIAGFILGLAFLVLVAAFFRTQVMEHERFRLQAQNNRLRAVPLAAPRGEIFDRYGRLIAQNVTGYTVKFIASKRDSLQAVLQRVSRIVPLEPGRIEDIIARYRSAPYQPVQVFGDASFETVSALEEHRPELPGLVIQTEPRRYYPAGKAVAHLVGYISEVTDADLEKDRYPGAVQGSVVGKAGVEQSYDSLLRGVPGVRYVEVNALGRLVRERSENPGLEPVSGRAIRTTIDLSLQEFVDSIWPPGVRGALVALTPRGEVLALYSNPAYDPNAFVGGIAPSLWRELNTDEARPLLNRAIQAIYPPASPFKLATATMALRRGLIDFDSHMPIACTGGLRLGNRYFKCWKAGGHGSLDLTGAIAGSCDVYFYQVGLRLGLNAIVEDGNLLGFRSRTGIDIQNESRPVYPASMTYFDQRYGRNWSAPATTLNFAIGQGEDAQTLISMVRFYQALADSGVGVTPFIVRQQKSERHDLGLTPEQLAGLRAALVAVVARGTAAGTRTVSGGLAVAGKTGTAQNPHGEDHGWFIGFAPAEEPEIIVGAVMEFAKHGSTVAPYVVRVLRRFVLGTEGPVLPLDTLAIPVDSAPRAVELAPDTAAIRR